jgi:acyl carrier protein
MFDEHQLRIAVADILGVAPEDLTPTTELTSFEAFDSTAHLSLMVCLSDFSSHEFRLSDFRNVLTYGDVIRLASQ